MSMSLDGFIAGRAVGVERPLGEGGEREGGAIPRGELLRSVMLNHRYHHRGRLTVYLRQTGAAAPAIYGDGADERAFPID